MEGFEHEGIFWDCKNPDLKLVGRVSFDPLEGAALKIVGTFSNIADAVKPGPPDAKRIHGVADRTLMTLLGCQSVSTSFESPGVIREEYRVSFVLSGVHLGADDDLTFDEVSASYDQLARWIHRTGFQFKLETPTPELANISKIGVEYIVQPEEVEQVDDLELKITLTWSTGSDGLTRFHIAQQTHLSLKYPELRGLDDILADTNGFQDLITLAADAPTVPVEISLWRTGLTREIALGQIAPQEIKLFIANAAEQMRQEKPQQPERMFFMFDHIGGLKTLGRWVDVSRRYRIVLGSLLTIRYSARLYEENRYSNVISAAETFHRLRFPNYIMPATDFKSYRRKLVKVVKLAVGRKAADWLMSQLLYSNEPRLRQRLEVMASYAGDGFTAIVGDVHVWSAVVVMLRNRLTHHDAGRDIKGALEDLHFLTDSIYLLVMMCLLRECRVPDDVLENIQNSERIKFLCRNIAQTLEQHHEYIRRG